MTLVDTNLSALVSHFQILEPKQIPRFPVAYALFCPLPPCCYDNKVGEACSTAKLSCHPFTLKAL